MHSRSRRHRAGSVAKSSTPRRTVKVVVNAPLASLVAAPVHEQAVPGRLGGARALTERHGRVGREVRAGDGDRLALDEVGVGVTVMVGGSGGGTLLSKLIGADRHHRERAVRGAHERARDRARSRSRSRRLRGGGCDARRAAWRTSRRRPTGAKPGFPVLQSSYDVASDLQAAICTPELAGKPDPATVTDWKLSRPVSGETVT